jgi:3-hydroxyacyl-CoA dehydrogenase
MNKPFERIAVVGVGFLGTQIAMVSAYAGYKVTAYDTEEGPPGDGFDVYRCYSGQRNHYRY